MMELKGTVFQVNFGNFFFLSPAIEVFGRAMLLAFGWKICVEMIHFECSSQAFLRDSNALQS